MISVQRRFSSAFASMRVDQSRRRDKARDSRQIEAEGNMGFAGAAIAKCDDVCRLDVFTRASSRTMH